LGYITNVIDDSIKDSKDARTFLSDKLKSFNHIKGSQNRKKSNESNYDLHTLDSNKKTKTDFMFNVSFNEYTTVINAVKSIQQDNESVYTCNFFSTNEIDCLMSMARSAIQEEKKHISKLVESFLEALLLSKIDVIDRNTINDFLKNIDADDKETIYVEKYIENTSSQFKQTVEIFIVRPCVKTPQTIFTYGENHSDAYRYDKIEHSEIQHIGKSSSIETDISENNGPTHKDNHDKSGRNPLLDSLQKGFWDWASESLPVKDSDVDPIKVLQAKVEDLENNIPCDDDDESKPIEYVACALKEALCKFQ
ncbi:8170_t:CDS:10, partial [Funneliformis caledonium]